MRPSPERPFVSARAALLFAALVVIACDAGPAQASAKRHAAAAAAIPAQLSLSGPSGSVRYGASVTLKASLSAAGTPLGSRQVALFRDGAALATAATATNGSARFRLKATRSAQYDVRFAPASAPDVAAFQPGTSKPVALVVRPLLRLRLSTALHTRSKAVGVPLERVRLSGRLLPGAPGEVTITVRRGAHRLRRVTRPVVMIRGAGRFGLDFKPRARGSYTFRIQTGQPGAARAAVARLVVVRASAGLGSSGAGVRALQARLSSLGYATPVTGSFDGSTERAVLAFRKANGMSRTTTANRAVFRRLERGGGGFQLRYPNAGRHVEFDWSRQVLVLAKGSRVARIVPASSGKPSTPTVFGTFHFYSKTAGYNSHGMYYSNYFIGGYAIHGYASVPPYAASHGCIRIPIPSAISVYRWIRLGDRISVYR
jgi:peptidoglycan hydrolase-like protein with peptidoglycan-binding domain